MLTYEAATWQDIIDIAYNGGSNFTDDVTIKLTSDINCNTEIPEGVASTIQFSSSSAHVVIIDGGYIENNASKRHVIRNLRTHVQNPVTIFNSNRYESISLKNIDFINLILDAYLLGGSTSSQNGITNCRFVGRRSTNLYNGNVSGDIKGVNFTSCFFNIPYVPNGSATISKLALASWYGTSATGTANQVANFCRFKETYGGWSLNNSGKYADSDLGTLRLNGCRVEGEVTNGYATNTSLILTLQYAFASYIQNVIDVDLKTSATEGTTISVSAPKGVWRDDIYSTDSSIVSTYEYTNLNNNAIPETPANMKNATRLYDDGFDIVH